MSGLISSKTDKIIARQQERIKNGEFYEAHQQLRVISARYIKQDNYDAAMEIICSGAKALLEAKQSGSGSDLCLLLLEVYGKAGITPDAQSKARLLSLLRAFPAAEITRKRFVNEMIAWSIKHGEFPAGDPELHHVAGLLYASEDEPYEAEKHLVLGTQDSPEVLVRVEYEWYCEDSSHTAPLYAGRAVIPYILTGNLRAANKALLLFTSRLAQDNASLGVQEVSGKLSDLRVYPSLPLLNFLGLLLLVVQRGAADLYRQLKSHYAVHLKDVSAWREPLDEIGQMYFDIKIPSQTNPLFDMMGSLLMGGKGGGNSGSKPDRKSAQD